MNHFTDEVRKIGRMPRKKKAPDQDLGAMVRVLLALAPVLAGVMSAGSMSVGVVVWAYKTFVTIDMYEKDRHQMLSTMQEIERNTVLHSDMNRDRMLSVVSEVNSNVKMLQDKLLNANPSARMK